MDKEKEFIKMIQEQDDKLMIQNLDTIVEIGTSLSKLPWILQVKIIKAALCTLFDIYNLSEENIGKVMNCLKNDVITIIKSVKSQTIN